MLATICAAGLCAPAAAQETMTFSIKLSDTLLEPGESVKVEVWAQFEPGVGQTAIWNTPPGTGQVGTVVAYSASIFDLLTPGKFGEWSNLTLNPGFIFNGFGVPGPDGVKLIAPVQSVFPLQDNPIFLWSAMWQPLDYLPGTVQFETVASLANVDLKVDGFALPVWDTWSPIDGSAELMVIPAPPAALLILGACAPRLRRRRTQPAAFTPRAARSGSAPGSCPSTPPPPC